MFNLYFLKKQKKKNHIFGAKHNDVWSRLLQKWKNSDLRHQMAMEFIWISFRNFQEFWCHLLQPFQSEFYQRRSWQQNSLVQWWEIITVHSDLGSSAVVRVKEQCCLNSVPDPFNGFISCSRHQNNQIYEFRIPNILFTCLINSRARHSAIYKLKSRNLF